MATTLTDRQIAEQLALALLPAIKELFDLDGDRADDAEADE